MFWQSNLKEFIDNESSLKYRLLLLEYFAAIAGTIWGLVTLFYIAVDSVPLAVACLTGSVISFSTVALIRARPGTRQFLANLFLFANVMTLCSCVIMSWEQGSHATLYFPIVIILAAQLVGFRVALVWSLTMLFAAVITYMHDAPSETLSEDNLSRLIHTVGTIVTALWLSFESEKFFNSRTRHLEILMESLQEKTRLLELAEETAGVGHWRWDPKTGNISLSKEARLICDLDSDDSRDQQQTLGTFIEVWGNDFQPRLLQRFVDAKKNSVDFNQELSFESTTGLRHVSCRGVCEIDESGYVTGIFGTLRDDTQLQSATDRLIVKAEELNQLASFDPLTGLSNRFQFQQQFSNCVDESVKHQQQMALLVLDMDGFKEINDSLGHATGDEVLKVAAQRLEQVVRDGDLVSRLGGDEFTVVVRDAENISELEGIARRIVEAIAMPMNIDGHELTVGVSIGASVCPRDSSNADELFTFSDTAMYAAKASKLGLAIYDAEMTEKLLSRRLAEGRLAGALERDEFRLVYQPQSNIETGEIIGFESLLRWRSDGDNVPPLKFIPLLEGNGKIIEVGQWVLDQACQQVAKWHAAGRDLGMAVNISPVQFREPTFADRVIETISKYPFDPKLIEVEITEGLLIQDLNDTNEKLFKLKEFGVRISVDDFGTGYSSLAYLKHLPIDQLKIDRTFIKDFPEHDDGTIASSIIVLGQSLDMDVLAEGVETEEQLAFLRSQACDFYQGHLLGLPMSPKECEELLSQHDEKRATEHSIAHT